MTTSLLATTLERPPSSLSRSISPVPLPESFEHHLLAATVSSEGRSSASDSRVEVDFSEDSDPRPSLSLLKIRKAERACALNSSPKFLAVNLLRITSINCFLEPTSSWKKVKVFSFSTQNC